MRSCFQLLCVCALASHMALGALFGDRVLAKGKGFEVTAGEVESAFISFKANEAAGGKQVPESPEEIKKFEAEILDRLIATKLFLANATETDRTNAAPVAEAFIKEKRGRATSEASFRRQMLAIGLTVEQFEKEVREQALVKSVIDRMLRSKQTVTDEETEKFYKDNPTLFEEPQKWRVAHVHMANVERTTLRLLTPEEQRKKEAIMRDITRRARGGEDFAKLAKEYSEDYLSKDQGGEYTMVRGQMPPEFEAATISLKQGQVSDMVTTRFGWHVIKLLEVIPPKTVDFASSKQKIKDAILQQKTQKALPDFIKELRKAAGVEVLDAAK